MIFWCLSLSEKIDQLPFSGKLFKFNGSIHISPKVFSICIQKYFYT
jgi:hypothetical protein